MKARYSRRQFLGHSARALIATGSYAALSQDVQAHIREENEASIYKKGFSVLQGLTDETTTQLSIDVPKDHEVFYRLVDRSSGSLIDPQAVNRQSRDFSSWAVDQVSFVGLRLGVVYLFQVLDAEAAVLDERELKTVDLGNPEPRIAALSCMMDFSFF